MCVSVFLLQLYCGECFVIEGIFSSPRRERRFLQALVLVLVSIGLDSDLGQISVSVRIRIRPVFVIVMVRVKHWKIH